MKTNRKLNVLTDFKSLEFEVPKICLNTGCVSARRDRHYPVTSEANGFLLCSSGVEASTLLL